MINMAICAHPWVKDGAPPTELNIFVETMIHFVHYTLINRRFKRISNLL